MPLPACRSGAVCARQHRSQPQGPRRALFCLYGFKSSPALASPTTPRPSPSTHPPRYVHIDAHGTHSDTPNSYSHAAAMREVISLNGTSRYAPTRLDRP
jgi:hypothetical protein